MKVSHDIVDILIIGGGINGVGIAADASGRGLKVLLCEKGDLASGTSQWSTKLIHGGLRYLETYEFSLVRKALKESEILLGLAPHLIEPICIHIPYMKHQRPWLLIRLGLFLYNSLAHRPKYKSAKAVRFKDDCPLKADLTHGFRVYDAQVDDARLVMVNALQADQQGAKILTRTECINLTATEELWEAQLLDHGAKETRTVKARVVVNATGPWVGELLTKLIDATPQYPVRLVKGSHIVVPRIQPVEQAYLLQNEDGRVVFVLPWQQEFSLVGTTEEEFHGDPGSAKISDAEIEYLLGSVNRYFKQSISRRDIVHSFAGIRPLLDEKGKQASKVTRDYRLEFENTPLPLLTVYGGKITTYRLLAKDAVDKLGSYFPGIKSSRTDKTPLPGSAFKLREQLYQRVASSYAWMRQEVIKRWVVSYGSISLEILKDNNSAKDLGVSFGHGLFQLEVDYLIDSEWARSADDILWRRSKLGLLFNKEQSATLAHYVNIKVETLRGRKRLN